jgi:glycosyltransferase involved in cell wall biosynthesis
MAVVQVVATGKADRRRRVLIVVQNLSVPLDRRVWLECQALVAAGYGVSVICPRGPEEPAFRVLDGVHIHTYRPPRATSTSGLLSYVLEFLYCWLATAWLSLRVLRREGFDVLQACNPPDTYWLLGLLYKVIGKRFVYDQHDLCPEVYEARFGRRGALHRVLLLLERATYAVADHVISPNRSYQEIAWERGQVPAQKSSIVMSAPDPDQMKRGEPDDSLRAGRKFLCCYLGIMGPQDGVDRLLQAVDHYVNVLGREDCHFGLLGFGDSQPALERMTAELGLQEWVTFTGRVGPDEIKRWLSTADLGVTPDPPCEFNDRSTMNKTLEYMAHGVPVVATELTETYRSAQDAAVYVPGGDPESFAKAIADLLDSPDRRWAMGQDGRWRIERELAWPLQARVYVRVYDGLTGRESAATVGDVPAPARAQESA